MDFKHCDDYIKDKTQPMCLRKFLLHKRIPAYWQIKYWKDSWGTPELFATIDVDSITTKGGIKYDIKKALEMKNKESKKRVRVVMASRFGDVGITPRLDAKNGYSTRVPVEWLSDFKGEP